MFLFIEPVSKNIGMYVPAYPLPLIEIASYVKSNRPEIDMEIISISVDYGLPLTQEGKERLYHEVMQDIREIRPKGIGISCTAISQAEEAIYLCEAIKEYDPNIFIFLGGYFPTIYYEEIFSLTSSIDAIIIGEGEIPTLKILEYLEKGRDPKTDAIPNLSWKENGQIHITELGMRFDLNKKAPLKLDLLRYPKAYDILPYSFSRGCPYKCNFCMEDYIRPTRKTAPSNIIREDLSNLSRQCHSNRILVCDALFKSFDLVPFIRSLGMKINFETRCDVLDPAIIPDIKDVCSMLILGFESASFNTLLRMNKVRDWAHYQQYIANTKTIFTEAVQNGIPVTVFLIAGYPGDTEEDLNETLHFIKELSKKEGPGGFIFKIGECHVYPKTKIQKLALSLPDVEFDDDGIFGQNIVRQPSKNLDFKKILDYIKAIFQMSHSTPSIQEAFSNMMPLFRLPVQALKDELIPDRCFKSQKRDIYHISGENLAIFRELSPQLIKKYKEWMSKERNTRILNF